MKISKKNMTVFLCFWKQDLSKGGLVKDHTFPLLVVIVVTWCDSDDDDDDSDVGANCGVPIKAIIPPSVNSGQT